MAMFIRFPAIILRKDGASGRSRLARGKVDFSANAKNRL